MTECTPAEIAKGLTKAQARDVLFFATNGRTCRFAKGEPSDVMRRRLIQMRLLATDGREPGRLFGLTFYTLTDLGRAVAEALREKDRT